MNLSIIFGPTSIVGPKYLPNIGFSSGYWICLSLKKPIIESMLAEFTDIWSSTDHHCLRDLYFQCINIQGCIQYNLGLKLQYIVPYPLRCANSDRFPTSAIIQISGYYLSLQLPWTVCIRLLYVTIRLLEFISELSNNLLLWSIHQHLRRNTIFLEEWVQGFILISLIFHLVLPWPTKLREIKLII